MDNSFYGKLKVACCLSIEETVAQYNISPPEPAEQRELNAVDKNTLAKKILALSEDYIHILFFRYVFHCDAETTEAVLGLENCTGRLHHAKELLAIGMGFPKNTGIGEESWEKAGRLALYQYVLEAEVGVTDIAPVYSSRFRRRLKTIRSAQKKRSAVVVFVRRAAIFFLVMFISFAGTLAVNAELRERFFNWVVHTFPQFSEFGAEGVTAPQGEENFEELQKYHPEYIPDGFEVYDTFIVNPMVIIEYRDVGNDRFISFHGNLPTEKVGSFDTEDAVIENIFMNGGSGFYWERDGLYYVVWEQDGYIFNLITGITKDVTLRIAESVKK